MDKYICEICGKDYGYVILYLGREMSICKQHFDYLESVKHSIIAQMIELNRKTGEN